MPLKIGPHTLRNPVILAPMAGVTDLPFRQLTHRLGAGMVVSEMVTSDKRLWHTKKSMARRIFRNEPEPRSVQIVGGDPCMMAESARMNEAEGAQIIDINMGCPAKKVCNKAAGSALLRDEDLVRKILEATVKAVDVPVTLKIRTGWSPDLRNGVTIARIAEDSGIQALAVHGRTRSCRFAGEAEYDTIANIKNAVHIPVVANGDITSAEKARFVMEYTNADAIMIGRAAQGNPWIFREITTYLETGQKIKPPETLEIKTTLLRHLECLYRFYGEYNGVRIARKHVGWYLREFAENRSFSREFNSLESPETQYHAIEGYFDTLEARSLHDASHP